MQDSESDVDIVQMTLEENDVETEAMAGDNDVDEMREASNTEDSFTDGFGLSGEDADQNEGQTTLGRGFTTSDSSPSQHRGYPAYVSDGDDESNGNIT